MTYKIVSAGVAFAAAAFSLSPAWAAPRGKSLALAQCAQCHVVAADQGFAPPERPQGPDFSAIAANAKNTPKHLRHFLLTTHKNPGGGRPGMPRTFLTMAQVDDVVSFILSKPSEDHP